MDNRRLLLFFLISLTILLGWQWLMPEPARRPAVPAPTPSAAATTARATDGEPGGDRSGRCGGCHRDSVRPAPRRSPPPAKQRLVLDTEEFRAVFTNRGAQLVSFQVKEHRDEKGRPLELVRARQQGPWPLGLVDADLRPLPLDDALFASRRERDAEGHEVLRFDYRGPAGSARKVVRVLGPRPAGARGGGLAAGLGPAARPRRAQPERQGVRARRSQPRQAVYRAAGGGRDDRGAGGGEADEPARRRPQLGGGGGQLLPLRAGARLAARRGGGAAGGGASGRRGAARTG